MFDATRFTATKEKSNLSSVVSNYEVAETIQASETEIGLVYADMLVCFIGLLPVTSVPFILIAWYIWPIPYPVISSVTILISVIITLNRYDHNLRWLKERETIATGTIDWQKHELTQANQASKTQTIYLDYQALSEGDPQPQEIQFGINPQFSFPPQVLQDVFTQCIQNDYKFTKRLMKGVKGINDNNYNTLVTELIEARWLRLKGDTLKKGVEPTNKGKKIMKGRLLALPSNHSPTP